MKSPKSKVKPTSKIKIVGNPKAITIHCIAEPIYINGYTNNVFEEFDILHLAIGCQETNCPIALN